MLSAMSFNFWVVLTIGLSFAVANFGFAMLTDHFYIKKKRAEKKEPHSCCVLPDEFM